MSNDEYPADYGRYLDECYVQEKGTVGKSYEEWKAEQSLPRVFVKGSVFVKAEELRFSRPGESPNALITGEMVEELATMMAVGNNGGTWADHYTEDQKNTWRNAAHNVIAWVIERVVG